MKTLYLRTFGTDTNGKRTYQWTEQGESAALYHEIQANIDCDLLNRLSNGNITPEAGGERLVFENFHPLKVAERLFCIAFESRTEVERAVFTLRS